MVAALTRRAAILILLGWVPGWGQQSPPVTLQVAPKDLSLAAGERRQVVVVATVTGQHVRNLTLRARPEPGAHAVIGKRPKLPDEVRGDVSWPVSISKDADGKTASRIVFEAQYESGEKDPLPGLVQTTFDLTVKQRPKNDEVATATVQTGVEKLEERRPRDVYLVVTNLTDVPLEVTDVRVTLPAFARISVDGIDQAPSGGWSPVYSPGRGQKPERIPPRQEHIFTMVLKIQRYQPVVTGKYLMLFHVGLRYAKDGYSTESSIVTPHEFQAGVLGEQEFVGVTTVPFLLLPGFLVVTIGGLLLGKVWPKWPVDPNFTKPEFYLVGVVVSFIMVLAYRYLSTPLFLLLWRTRVPQRDLFAGFSLEDIVNVWTLSLAVVLLPWALVGGGWSISARVRAKMRKDKTPTVDDRPLEVLGKLARAGKSFALAQATVNQERLWELPLPSPDPAKKWVSGRVYVTIHNKGEQRSKDFLELLGHTSETSRLWETLRKLDSDKAVDLDWQPKRQPALVDKKDAPTAAGEPEDFVYAE